MPKLKLPDVEISFTIDDYTDPWKRTPWVLLHHALAGSSRQWYGWVPALARHYRVLRYDARGHGDSTWPASNGHFSLDTLVSDVLQVLDALDIKRVHFVGASGGAAVGLKLAHDHAHSGVVRSLTLVAATPRLAGPGVDLARWNELIDKAGVKGWLLADAPARFGEANLKLAEWLAEEGARTPVAVAKTCLSAMADADLTGILPNIRTRTLLLASDNDDVAPPAVQELMRDRLRKATLKVYPGLGHNIQTLMPDTLAAEALAFMKASDDLEELSAGMGEC
ncbi:MAG: alpha/beta hydrolase [Chloroflexi bacterium]|nr:alpha/beta hydrolase [Chloroflexota bacterium]